MADETGWLTVFALGRIADPGMRHMWQESGLYSEEVIKRMRRSREKDSTIECAASRYLEQKSVLKQVVIEGDRRVFYCGCITEPTKVVMACAAHRGALVTGHRKG